jgi:hypothetical protein
MKQFLRRTALSLIAAALTVLALWVPAGAAAPGRTADLGLQNASLSCSDGTLLQLALSTSELTALADAVTAINLYPAGDPALACSLTQSTAGSFAPAASLSDRASSPSASGNPNTDYAVGGGRATLFACGSPLVPAETNFALNGRVGATSNGSAGTGTFNLTLPPSQCSEGGGHFNGKIDCVKVGGNGPGSAQATFTVTQAQGILDDSQGEELRVDVLDSGVPGGTGDLIRLRLPSGPCDFSGYSATRPVDNGNISVHQVS